MNLQVMKASLGERVTLNCSVRGLPIPTIFWETQGQIVEAGKGNIHTRLKINIDI